MAAPPVREGSGNLGELPSLKKQSSKKEAAVSGVGHQALEQGAAAKEAAAPKAPAPASEAATPSVTGIALNELHKQLDSPVQYEMWSLLNGAKSSEVARVTTPQGPQTYSTVALRDFATRAREVTGSIALNRDPNFLRHIPSNSEANVVNDPNFPNTIFGQVKSNLERWGVIRNPLSATNVILSATSQAHFPTLGVERQYIETHQQPPVSTTTFNEVIIKNNSIIIHCVHTLKPGMDLDGNMIMKGPDDDDAALEARRDAVCQAHPERMWTVKSTIEIPISEFNKPDNVYGNGKCDIKFKLTVDVTRGEPVRQRKRDFILKPVKGALGKMSGLFYGTQPQPPPKS